MVAREYTGVAHAEEEDDRPLQSSAIAELVCRDCFGASAVLAGFGDSVFLTMEYIELEEDVAEFCLDVRSPSGAIVHDNSPAYDTITRVVSKFCVGGMF